MKTKFFIIVLIAFAGFTSLSLTLPSGWRIAGTKPQSCEIGIDRGSGPGGSNSATIKSLDKKRVMGKFDFI